MTEEEDENEADESLCAPGKPQGASAEQGGGEGGEVGVGGLFHNNFSCYVDPKKCNRDVCCHLNNWNL